MLFFIPLSLHVLKTKIFFLFFGTGIFFLLQLWVWFWYEKILDIAVCTGIFEGDRKFLLSLDSGVELVKKLLPSILLWYRHGVTWGQVLIAKIEDLFVQLVTNLRKQTLDGSESAAKCARLDRETKVVALQDTSLRFEDISRQIFNGLHLQLNSLSFIRDGTSGLDVARAVATMVADSAPYEHFLEIRDANLLHVDNTSFRAARTVGWERVHISVDNVKVVRVPRNLTGLILFADANAEGLILFLGTLEFLSLVSGTLIVRCRSDPRVASGIFQGHCEWERFTVDHLSKLLEDFIERLVGGRVGGFAQWLFAFELGLDLGEETFDIGKLSLTSWHFYSESFEAEDRAITLDDLAVKVAFVMDLQGVLRAMLLDLAGSFDRIILVAAVRTLE